MARKATSGRIGFGGVALFAGLAGLTAGCSTIESVVPSPSTLASLVSFNSSSSETPNQPAANGAQAMADDGRPKEIDCPQIEVQDGTSAMRVGGDANASVRYQFDIADTARECKVEGAQFAIKVGVEGRLLIGPAGSAGAYSAPLRIVVRDDATQKPVLSKLYKVDADATAATSLQAPFQFVSEPLMLPYTHRWADQDYTILVGFDTAHAAPEEKHLRKKHKN
jgi:hypothetical protein